MNWVRSHTGMNPIVVKELRSRMRGNRVFLTLSIILFLTGGALIGMIYLMTGSSDVGNSMLSYEIGSILFTLLINLELIIICMVAPAVTAGSISGEVEKLTFDLLLATPLNPSSIVSGKLISAMSYVLLILFAAIPMASIVFVFGGITLSSMLKAFIMLWMTAIMAATIGLFFSSWFRRTGRATIVSLMMVFCLMLLPIFISVLLLITNNEEVPRWLVAVSPISAVSSSILPPGGQQTGYNPLSIMFFGGIVDQTLVPISQTSIPRPIYHYSLVIFSALSIVFYLGSVSLVNPLRRCHLTRRQALSGVVLFALLVCVTLAGFLLTADHYEWYRSSSSEEDFIPTITPFEDEMRESQKVIVPDENQKTSTPSPLPPPMDGD